MLQEIDELNRWQARIQIEVAIHKVVMKKGVPVHFVVCLDNDGYPASLEVGKHYRLIPDVFFCMGARLKAAKIVPYGLNQLSNPRVTQ